MYDFNVKDTDQHQSIRRLVRCMHSGDDQQHSLMQIIVRQLMNFDVVVPQWK